MLKHHDLVALNNHSLFQIPRQPEVNQLGHGPLSGEGNFEMFKIKKAGSDKISIANRPFSLNGKG